MDNKKYRWRIEEDHLAKKHICDVRNRKNKLVSVCCGSGGFGECEAGISGPLDCYQGYENPTNWEMYDDDGVLYYSGMIWGEYTGFEPLDDWGAPNAGCTSIKINGKEL